MLARGSLHAEAFGADPWRHVRSGPASRCKRLRKRRLGSPVLGTLVREA